ncbi:hypothetical protein DFH29DRAFT_779182, partial [Suillus ampliporus]
PHHHPTKASRMCARFITHLFACPKYPPSSSNFQILSIIIQLPNMPHLKLPHFIAYALHRTKLHASATL